MKLTATEVAALGTALYEGPVVVNGALWPLGRVYIGRYRSKRSDAKAMSKGERKFVRRRKAARRR